MDCDEGPPRWTWFDVFGALEAKQICSGPGPWGWLDHEGHRFYKYLSPHLDHMAWGIRRQIRRRGKESFSCAGSLVGDAEFMIRVGGIK